jgi:hypothetical protein
MRLTWENSEWDNFSGVASKDNLMMLNEGNDFLNAGGNDGNWRNDRKYYAGDETSIDFKLDDLRIRDKGTGKIINTNLGYIKSKLEEYLAKADTLRKERDAINVTTSDYTRNSKDNQGRANKNQNLWFADRMVARLEAIVKDFENKILEQEKAKAEADAKAKAEAEAKAKAEADAKAEAERIAQMKSLNDQLINAKTPEEKKSIQAQIDALAGNVAKGGSKYLTYGIIGLVVVVGAFMLFKRNN